TVGIGRRVSGDGRGELPEDRNVLHFEDEAREELRRRSQLAAEETRAQFGPTQTLPREDPSYGETLRTSNERAYAEDARCFMNS
ncbi:MAG: Clp protease ClpP, partial [Alistipes senegalensis]|nr:Clp protease ClpP [Alistipes senegalensis]